MLIRVVAFTAALLATSAAFAGPDCTQEPREKWIPPVEMLTQAMKDVPKMNVFKVTKGNCYEIYGWDAKGEKVEIYYHPITGEIAKRGTW
ncbi:PepSY domain-containing protein [Halothiobacillus sp. DCM-1]|uniref:PepSY domain-containing protein n=1 Tax=Halothiobacillus sp. DCM-1 TaxID=3112558 RepID=UPI00325493E6